MKKDAVGLSTAKGGLIRGAQLLNGRFIAQWAKDNYRDYTKGRAGAGVIADVSFARTVFTSHVIEKPKTNSRKKRLQGASVKNSTTSLVGEYQQQTDSTFVNIDDDSALGDDRIDPSSLRKLLTRRPDLVRVLQSCLDED